MTESWFMELKQPGWRRRQDRHKFPNWTMKNVSFARLARAYLSFVHFICPSRPFDGVKSRVLQFCGQTFNFILLSLKRWLQFTFRILRTHFGSLMSMWNDWRDAKLPFQMTFSLTSTSSLHTIISSLFKIIVSEWGERRMEKHLRYEKQNRLCGS